MKNTKKLLFTAILAVTALATGNSNCAAEQAALIVPQEAPPKYNVGDWVMVTEMGIPTLGQVETTNFNGNSRAYVLDIGGNKRVFIEFELSPIGG